MSIYLPPSFSPSSTSLSRKSHRVPELFLSILSSPSRVSGQFVLLKRSLSNIHPVDRIKLQTSNSRLRLLLFLFLEIGSTVQFISSFESYMKMNFNLGKAWRALSARCGVDKASLSRLRSSSTNPKLNGMNRWIFNRQPHFPRGPLVVVKLPRNFSLEERR